MINYELISVVVQIATALLLFAGLIYAGKQVSILARTHNETISWNRKIATQELLIDFNNSNVLIDLQVHFDFLNSKHAIRIEEIHEKIKDNSELKIKIHRLLNTYETFSRGILLGLYDEELVKNARKSSMKRTYIVFEEYINHRRNEQGTSVFIEFQHLIERWEEVYKRRDLPVKLGELSS